MPHVLLFAVEEQLVGREAELVAVLTDAVVSVYGEWARSSVDVRLIGIPAGRWDPWRYAGRKAAPVVQFGMREEVLSRTDADPIVAGLVMPFTDAVAAVFGDLYRDELLVELIGQPTSRSRLGLKVIGDSRGNA